ncbi:MAG: hypothetical protein A2V63_00940 [Candidatus Eisenbacteria bacterium RBG_19FT_COMBO_70_11]|nr:MAG: hypothetical protein A2V63_00940 [Candidatus Eisenbacteria bacterium RBG_19FT_COMBO_70_11]
MMWKKACFASLVALALALGSQVRAQPSDPLPDIQRGDIAVNLQPIVTGLGAPDYAISPPGDVHRLFVLEQKGLLLVIENGTLLPTPALDIQTRVAPPMNPANANDERGLLGLAFHPGFNTPGSVGFGTLYTYHSELIPVGTTPTYDAPNGAVQNYKNVVAEWKISATDPNQVDPNSRREVISFGKNAGNHNGGTVAFGPDGYLFLALGDGGNANDVGASHIEPGGNAQNLSTPLGKMLRFDPVNPALTPGSPDPVSSNGQYRIPATNPFQGPGQVPEIYAYGLRNPYRFSFDGPTGDLILADVGQRNIEEIDRITLGGNYGWAVKEGDFLFDRATGTIGARSPGSPAGLIDPLSGPLGTLEYDHTDGIAVTGGFVYRGTAIPELFGKYVFGDLALRNAPPRVDGRIFYADLAGGEILEFLLPQFLDDLLPNGLTVHGFGEDGNGELYALVTNTPANGTGGIVYRFAPIVQMAFDFKPHDLNLNSKGMWVTGYLRPPVPYLASQIDASSIRLNGAVAVSSEYPAKIEDHDTKLKVKFLRSEVKPTLTPGDHVAVIVTGMIAGQHFTGTDFIKVKAPKVHTPKAGDLLAVGTTTEVTWDVLEGPQVESVSLLSSVDDGLNWTVAAEGLPNNGSYNWMVPGTITDQARLAIMVTYAMDETGVIPESEFAVSDAFSITATTGVDGGAAVFALRTSNPVIGPLTVNFSLASGAPATVAVYDIGGRQVASREVGSGRAGSHTVKLGDLPAGVYVVRLSQAGRSLSSRVAVIR